MATGLYVLQDGSVMVAYGRRHIPISSAQYKANGYKPALEKLVMNPLAAQTPRLRRAAEDRAVRPEGAAAETRFACVR
jgi:hypothetical protein